jgi:DNA-binding response OmpR family regulator
MARVLIVDDEPAYRQSLRLLVPCEGFEVETAATGEEAFDIARRFVPDVLVVDWMLNDRGDGLGVAETLRAAHPGLRVVVITGYPTASLESRVHASSSIQFLTKPFTLSDLTTAIHKALARE